jgi:tRNA A37 threonylcarbamoyladenosine modification protein TsaB
MRIYIDSTDNKKSVIRINDKEFTRHVESPRDQDVLGFLVHCLEAENIRPEDIDEIEVNPGPGSFTGTRVGVAIANVLGYALDIKVNGSMTPVDAIYSSPPSITKKKDT